MLPIKNYNKKYLFLALAGSIAALAFASIFLYIGIQRNSVSVHTPIHFASPQALVDKYIAGVESLESAYILGSIPVNVDAIIFRLTEMRVPQEILDVHLRAVLALEKMKQTPGVPAVQKQEIGELFTRLKTSATKITL